MQSVLRQSVLRLSSRSSSSLVALSAARRLAVPCRKWRYSIATFTSSAKSRETVTAKPLTEAASVDRATKEDKDIYVGPLSGTFRRLKLFSLASLGLSSTLAPFMFLVESNLGAHARFALVGIALATSGLSTSLVAWCAKPYVLTMRRFHPEGAGAAEELEMTTMTLTLRPRITKVYDPSFLIETSRPLAQWELARQITLTPDRTKEVGTNVHPAFGLEETVAETRDKDGNILGRWVVKWGENGVGTCHQVGHVVRYFNVHEELLK